MGRTRAPYSPEFRRQMVDLVRAGRDPTDLARRHRRSRSAPGLHWLRARTAAERRKIRPMAYRSASVTQRLRPHDPDARDVCRPPSVQLPRIRYQGGKARVGARHYGGRSDRVRGGLHGRSGGAEVAQPEVQGPRAVSGPNLLSGICFCAHCCGAKTLRTGKRIYRYYACSTKARQGETGCVAKRCRWTSSMRRLSSTLNSGVATRAGLKRSSTSFWSAATNGRRAGGSMSPSYGGAPPRQKRSSTGCINSSRLEPTATSRCWSAASPSLARCATRRMPTRIARPRGWKRPTQR